MANTSNTDRALRVLGNLSREFSDDKYGGVVKSEHNSQSLLTELIVGIELMNEPRINEVFTMTQLKAFYTASIKTVRDSSGGKLSATIHGMSPPTQAN